MEVAWFDLKVGNSLLAAEFAWLSCWASQPLLSLLSPSRSTLSEKTRKYYTDSTIKKKT